MLGQNFLVDRNVINRIIDLVAPRSSDHILEIGPGQGAMTRELVSSGASVVAVELDRRLAPLLAKEFASQDNFAVVEADILDTDLQQLLGSRSTAPWKVAANLPYNISSQVLFKFMEEKDLFEGLVLMLQKEVGDRLTAPAACKEYGALTVLLRLHFDIRREFIVKPGSFRPVPKVDSAVLSFTPLAAPRVEVGDEGLFRRLVKGAFNQRRKTLLNSLRSAGFDDGDGALSAALSSCGIDPVRRGETLSLDEFGALSRVLSAGKTSG